MMKITKYGHCCLLIEEGGLRVLTDPGNFSTLQSSARDVDVVLITHEHADHFHVDSVKEVLGNNPKVKVITNASVARLLADVGVTATVVGHGMSHTERGVTFSGFGTEHALIYPSWTKVENTGYFIGDRLFYPGDAFYDPKCPVDVLALPVAGPWCKISEAVDYALQIKPKVAFPVHDGGLKAPGVAHRLPEKVLHESGIRFVAMVEGQTAEF